MTPAPPRKTKCNSSQPKYQKTPPCDPDRLEEPPKCLGRGFCRPESVPKRPPPVECTARLHPTQPGRAKKTKSKFSIGNVHLTDFQFARATPVILIASKSRQNALVHFLLLPASPPAVERDKLRGKRMAHCAPAGPGRSIEEGRLLSKPAFHPSSQPLLLLPASLFAFGRVRAAFHCCRLSGAPKMNYISFLGRLDGCEAPGNRLEGTREK